MDYFRFTSDDPDVVEAFVEAYGKAPRRLEVYLPYHAPEENFETWMEEWSAGGLVHRCDGETVTIHRDDDGSYNHDPVPCPYESGKKERTKSDPGCTIVGRLHLVLPDLLRAGYAGYVVLETHSNHDLRNIMSALLAADGGKGLQGIPFTLRRRNETISTPGGDGKRVRREKSLVSIVPSQTWLESRLALARAEAFAELPAGLDAEEVVEGDVLYQSSNGDEDEPEPDPEPEDEWTHDAEWARKIVTPKGNKLGDLNADQLLVVFEHEKSTPVLREATSILLNALQLEAAGMEDGTELSAAEQTFNEMMQETML